MFTRRKKSADEPDPGGGGGIGPADGAPAAAPASAPSRAKSWRAAAPAGAPAADDGVVADEYAQLDAKAIAEMEEENARLEMEMNAPDDLASLPQLTNDAVMRGVELRYAQDKIYTRINTLLIGLNPYVRLPIYGEDQMKAYQTAPAGTLPPHIYGTAAATYAGLLNGRSQSLVISGESGAGKSETAKKVLQYLAFAASSSSSTATGGEGLEARILASNPILEAFGNAKTALNNNSSRYGKFLMLQFNNSGRLVGARINTYLLEKTRVVQPGEGERGYHVGYMLCGMRRLADPLKLPEALALNYTGRTGCLTSPGWDDDEEMKLTEEALVHVGVNAEAQEWLWRVVAALMLLGQLEFGDDAEAKLTDVAPLEQLAGLLKVDFEPMQRALSIKMTKVGQEWIAQPFSPAKASEMRHGLARTMYSAIFDYLVAQINRSLQMGRKDDEIPAPAAAAAAAANTRQTAAPGGRPGAAGGRRGTTKEETETTILLGQMQARQEKFIGILDIFGFETFKVNSLEQLCINFCNERLQATFNESVFAAVQEENAAEGITLPAADLSDVDNSEVVRLIGGRPGGVLHSINEECVVPKGSDESFVEKLLETHKESNFLKKPIKEQCAFTVVHFVGPVVYSAKGMLMKNKDPISEDLMVLLQHSQSLWVKMLFGGEGGMQGVKSKKKEAKFKGVAAKFQQQLEDLLQLVGWSDLHFVRCIKPNPKKVPKEFDPTMVETQLRCSGVFEAVRVIGMGFPDRLPHFQIYGQYAQILPKDERPAMDEWGHPEEGEGAAVKVVMTALNVGENEYAVGHSKVFFKAGVLPKLRLAKEAFAVNRAVTIQRYARRRLARNTLRRLRTEKEQAAFLKAEAERKAIEDARRAEEEAKAAAAAEARAKAQAKELKRSGSQAELAGPDAQGLPKPKPKLGLGLGLKLGGGGGDDAAKPVATGDELAAKSADDAAKEAGEEVDQANSMLQQQSKLHKSRASLLAGEDSGSGRSRPGASPTLKLGGGSPALLSHRAGGGGGFAPLLSHRAPNRNQVNKVMAEKNKTSEWLELVLEYASYLGMDPEQDEELLWIAEQALRAPVPEGWEELMDPLGNLYFYNEDTMQATRQHPMDGYYQSLYRKLRMQMKAGGSGGNSQMKERQGGGGGGGGGILTKRGGSGGGGMTKRGGKGGKGGGGLTTRGGGGLTTRGNGGLTTRGGPKGGRRGSGNAMTGGRPGAGAGNRSSLGELDEMEEETGGYGADGVAPLAAMSISQAMEMATPRTAAFMLDRFGLKPDAGEDERCLLINPAIYRHETELTEMTAFSGVAKQKSRRGPGGGGGGPNATQAARPKEPPNAFVECFLDKEELGMGMQAYSLAVRLNEGNEACALSATKRVANGNATYQLNVIEDDAEEDVHPFTGKLSCDPKSTNFVLYDDANEAAGKGARRELGLVVFSPRQTGQLLPIELIIPRVEMSGAAAQFRPTKVADALLSLYRAGKTRDLFILKGAAQLTPGGKVSLRFRGGREAATVFEAYRASGDRWAVRYRHPLSAYQAFAVAIAALHNATTAMLDMLPPLDEVPHAPPPRPASNLVCAGTYDKGGGQVYCVRVHGARVFCGLRSGFVQQWHAPLNAAPTFHEWRAHSECIYDVLPVGRVLVTASQDGLLRVWHLQTLHLLANLAGHKGRVRCVAGGSAAHPHRLFSGSNDRTVRVWDLAELLSGQPDGNKGQVFGMHKHWVRAVAVTADGGFVVSASKTLRVWSQKAPHQLLHTLPVGCWVYSLAVCDTEHGQARANTIYAGCSDGVIRCWNMSDLNTGMDEHVQLGGGNGKAKPQKGDAIRALAANGAVLYSGTADGRMRAWDLSSQPASVRSLQNSHNGAVRAIDADDMSNVVFSAGTDRTIKMWSEGGS